MNFKQFYQISERIIGLSSDELSYVDVLMQKIKDYCVPELWELGYAGLNLKSLDNFDKSGFGLIIHDFEEEPFPDLRISLYIYSPGHAGSYRHEPYVSMVPYKRLISPSGGATDDMFHKKLVGKSLIEIIVPEVEMPEKLKWIEKNFITKFLWNLIKKTYAPKVTDLRRTLEHELIHYKDPSIRIIERPTNLPHKRKSKDSEETSTINYRDRGKGYYTSGGEISGGVPTEFHPRIWTIIRNCKSEQDKKELLDWIKRPAPILPKCMESETEFVKYTWENPSLRRMFLRKLYDGITGRVSSGNPYLGNNYEQQ
jgi:hypothetical protein